MVGLVLRAAQVLRQLSRAQQVTQVQQANLDPLVHLASSRVQQATLEQLVRQALQVLQVLLVQQVPLVPQVLLAQQDLPVALAQQDQLAV